MRKRLLAAALGLVFSLCANAGDSNRQTSMAECNQDAGDKKGDERRVFMETCLNAKKETPQQVKMKMCSASVADMQDDARKKFMSECLKK